MFRAYRVFSLLQPRRPRHPIAQALLALFVVCAFVALLVIGAVVGLAVMVVAMIARALGFSRPFPFATGAFNAGARPQPGTQQAESHAKDDGVIDGEFHVVEKSLPHGPRV